MRMRPLVVILSVTAVVALYLSGCSSLTGRQKITPIRNQTSAPTRPQVTKPRPSQGEIASFMSSGAITRLPLNLLVLGLDASLHRSDVILAISVPAKGQISIVSVPRDTRIKLPGQGYVKVNQTYANGGAAATATAVQNLLGKKYPYHLVLSFAGMERLVDALGGVPMEVDHAMKYTDKAGGLYIDIKSGQQTLSGKKAVQYVRYRADGRGDVGRITRQQRFLAAWADALMQQPTRLLTLRNGLPQGVSTNMRLTETLRLAAKLVTARNQIKFAVLPGHADYVNKVSYWIPDAS